MDYINPQQALNPQNTDHQISQNFAQLIPQQQNPLQLFPQQTLTLQPQEEDNIPQKSVEAESVMLQQPFQLENLIKQEPNAPLPAQSGVPPAEIQAKSKTYQETVLEENYDYLLEEYNRQRRENETLKAQISKMKHNFNSMFTDLNKRQEELKKRLSEVKTFHAKSQENNTELRNQLWQLSTNPSQPIFRPTAFRPVALRPEQKSTTHHLKTENAEIASKNEEIHSSNARNDNSAGSEQNMKIDDK